MKVLSIAIPCYNSEAYMKRAISTLLTGGDDVEILIVDDGSKDKTAQIADAYAAKYPTIVKAIHQENGGHGEAVNAGLRNATGAYFKVVDSDDWVNTEAYAQILDVLRSMLQGQKNLDVLISNFVYEKQGAKRKRVMSYRSALPQNRIFTWRDIRLFRTGQYILMHSVIYRTQLLRDCGLELPKHTFYVDNLFVYEPLPHVKTMYYLNVNFYRYFIGREDQSVNEQVMIKRIDQQILVNKLMMDIPIMDLAPRKLRKYMLNYLAIITTVSSILAIKSDLPENMAKKKELWEYMKAQDVRLYRRLRHTVMGIGVSLKGKAGRKFQLACYKISQKIYGFN
ncbi:MAG: glycosyltransferase family 2 protein [Clostridia bacterium]